MAIKDIKKLARGHAENALLRDKADPKEALGHPNQHVRRSAWRLLGRPLPEDAEGRRRLAADLYPNHVKRLADQETANTSLKAEADKLFEESKAATSRLTEAVDGKEPEDVIATLRGLSEAAHKLFAQAERKLNGARRVHVPNALKSILGDSV
jgi:hypothetical protein